MREVQLRIGHGVNLMKRKFSIVRKLLPAFAVAVLMSSAGFGEARANAIINPTTGLNAYVQWLDTPTGKNFGLTRPVTSLGDTSGPFASITVSATSTIDVSITDGGAPGDAFALTLDGHLLTPTYGNLGANTRGPSATDFFTATYSNIVLSAGFHKFELFLTDSCCTGGGTEISFSEASPICAVPGPIVGAGFPGLMMALGGILAWRRRRVALAA